MQFKLVLLGAILLASGLIAYSSIPNIHRTPILQTQPLPAYNPITIPGAGAVELTYNLTVANGRQNIFLANVTVASSSGQTSTVLFQLFPKNQNQTCIDAHPKSYIANQEVSNQSLRIPINSSGPYCLMLDNEASPKAKTVILATSIRSSFEQVQVTNDGEMNIVGLGVGGFGFLVVVAGILKRTIIPWE